MNGQYCPPKEMTGSHQLFILPSIWQLLGLPRFPSDSRKAASFPGAGSGSGSQSVDLDGVNVGPQGVLFLEDLGGSWTLSR